MHYSIGTHKKKVLERVKKQTSLKVVVFVAIVIFSMQFLPVLSSPITMPVIVTLSGDQAVTYTAAKTDELLGGQAAIISASDALALDLILPRAVGAVIFVGHGSPDDVKVGGAMIPWQAFANSYLALPESNQIYLATCYSAEASEDLTQRYGQSNVLVSFKGCVDADFAAYYISSTIYALTGNYKESSGLLSELTTVMIGKILTPEKYDHYVLTSAVVDGIYFTAYNTPYDATWYAYTHPDWSYYGLNKNSQWAINPGLGMAVAHIPASVVSTYDMATILTNGVGAIGAAAAGLSTFVGIIVAALLLAAAVAENVFITTYVQDELGSSWFEVMPAFGYWQGVDYNVVYPFKLGAFPWCEFVLVYLLGFILAGYFVVLTSIGGSYLGYGGV